MKLQGDKKTIIKIGGGILIAAAIAFFLKSAAQPGDLKGMIQDAGSLIAKPVFAATGGIEDGFRGIFRFKDVLAENQVLKEENEALRQKAARLEFTKTEKEELEELCRVFDYSLLEENVILAANLTAMDESKWQEGFVIDRGSEDGIREGCTVVSGDGVVGKIAEVSPKSAKVASLLADGSKVSFQSGKSRDTLGIVQSDGKGGLSGYLLTEEEDIKKGERLETSGIGTYPEGLSLGKVTRVEKKKGTQRVLIEAEPQVAFARLKKVGVVL